MIAKGKVFGGSIRKMASLVAADGIRVIRDDWRKLDGFDEFWDAEVCFDVGQTFVWRLVDPVTLEPLEEAVEGKQNTYIGVVKGNAVALRGHERAGAEYRWLLTDGDGDGDRREMEKDLRRFLGCGEFFVGEGNLGEVVERDWIGDGSKYPRDAHRMRSTWEALRGWRVLRQDPWECLVAFLLSSNNNVERIKKLASGVRSFGRELGSVGGQTLWRMPSADEIVRGGEEALKGMGLGYRANWLFESSKYVAENHSWLEDVTGMATLVEKREHLMKLRGVGRKVADCVALFSMDEVGAVPVDVHVWAVARREGWVDMEVSSVGNRACDAVETAMKERFGVYCGWAHALRFAGELRKFRKRLPADIQREIQEFEQEERSKKAEERQAKKRRKAQDKDTSS